MYINLLFEKVLKVFVEKIYIQYLLQSCQAFYLLFGDLYGAVRDYPCVRLLDIHCSKISIHQTCSVWWRDGFLYILILALFLLLPLRRALTLRGNHLPLSNPNIKYPNKSYCENTEKPVTPLPNRPGPIHLAKGLWIESTVACFLLYFYISSSCWGLCQPCRTLFNLYLK